MSTTIRDFCFICMKCRKSISVESVYTRGAAGIVPNEEIGETDTDLLCISQNRDECEENDDFCGPVMQLSVEAKINITDIEISKFVPGIKNG